MGLNLKAVVLAATLGGVFSVQAQVQQDRKYYTVGKVKLEEVTTDALGNNKMEMIYEKSLSGLPNAAGQIDPTERVGKVISMGRDLVALGEDIYRLVIKGKPSNTTKYAPISVVPRVSGEAVDILETEGWSLPARRSYRLTWKNLYGIEVVKFQYSVYYSYRGSYNGAGAYLTAVQIVPDSVNTLFGFDFTATMKLGGIINQGTKANPVAGATLLMEYTVSSVMVANNNTDTFFVNGRGGFKKY